MAPKLRGLNSSFEENPYEDDVPLSFQSKRRTSHVGEKERKSLIELGTYTALGNLVSRSSKISPRRYAPSTACARSPTSVSVVPSESHEQNTAGVARCADDPREVNEILTPSSGPSLSMQLGGGSPVPHEQKLSGHTRDKLRKFFRLHKGE